MSVFDRFLAASLPITPRFVIGRVAQRYIAGETVDDAVRTIRALNAKGATCTVDVLGEFIEDLSEAKATARDYSAMLDAIERESLKCNISVKLTALGLLLDEEVCTSLVRDLVVRAAPLDDGFVRVDMEDSPVTDSTLALVRRLRGEGHPVGAVLQAYLFRTLDDAIALAAEGIPVRLCKGIYNESETIAYKDREEIRDSYRQSLRALLEGESAVGIATHDEVLVADALALIEELSPDPSRVEFQMLLGVREWMRDELIAKGHRVRIYVPFGANWYGYSTRRLKENPQIAGHVFRALLGFK